MRTLGNHSHFFIFLQLMSISPFGQFKLRKSDALSINEGDYVSFQLHVFR